MPGFWRMPPNVLQALLQLLAVCAWGPIAAVPPLFFCLDIRRPTAVARRFFVETMNGAKLIPRPPITDTPPTLPSPRYCPSPAGGLDDGAGGDFGERCQGVAVLPGRVRRYEGTAGFRSA